LSVLYIRILPALISTNEEKKWVVHHNDPESADQRETH
jgi:hypothetical protein